MLCGNLVKSVDTIPQPTQKVTRGDERTIYRITSARVEGGFRSFCLAISGREATVAQTIYPALIFLDLADLPTVAELLRERLPLTESAMAKTRAIKEQLGAGLGSGNSHLMDHLIQVRQLDCRSLRRLLGEVETGKIRAPQPAAIKQLGSLSADAKQRS